MALRFSLVGPTRIGMHASAAFGLTTAAVLGIAAAFITGCSSSAQVSESYRDPSHEGEPFSKVAVFWVGADPRVRRVAEDEIARSFGRGTTAKATSEIVPTEALGDTSKIMAFLTGEGFDAVLIGRPVQPQEKITYRGATGNPTAFMGNYGFYTYWSNSYAQLMSPGYIKDEEVFRVDTRLYSLGERKPIWAGLSSLGDVSSLRDAVSEYAQGVLNSLRAEKLIR